MNEKKMPVIFAGHGSPMLALEDTEVTKGLKEIGQEVVLKFGKPKAILAVSAHWDTHGTYVQSTESPRQIYDMYGFPKELYDFKYPVKGCPELSERVLDLLGSQVSVNDQWGIDHGTWTVLCHLFPDADVPVVQLSVDADLSEEDIYSLGQKLAPLREEGYLIFASGNVVHNLHMVDWDNAGGTDRTLSFNATVIKDVEAGNDQSVIHYENYAHHEYAVPTPEHFLPLIYMLGAAKGEKVKTFNDHSELGAISMTGFAFGF